MNAPCWLSPDPSRLTGSLDAHLRSRAIGRMIEHHPSLGSTSDRARELALAGAPHGLVVWADEQTRGRGRLQRSWVSPPGKDLLFTVVLRMRISAASVAALTPVIGVACARSLRRLDIPVELKWPNDLLAEDRKIGGILCELAAADENESCVLAGIGVNILSQPEDFPPGLRGKATSCIIANPSAALDRLHILAALLRELELTLDELSAAGDEAIRRDAIRWSATLGRMVEVDAMDEHFSGLAAGLAADWSLLVETGNQAIRRVRFGDVVHARLPDHAESGAILPPSQEKKTAHG
ncbi:MAG: Bifunctional ligase/repressor BirA [Myxococcota bacterium]|nr:Bifunctional ligase/repressor BirA [Myxococcota bacterium]